MGNETVLLSNLNFLHIYVDFLSGPVISCPAPVSGQCFSFLGVAWGYSLEWVSK